MKTLVTGVAGFIGSHMADRLIKEGHTVIGIDNLITGNLDNVNKDVDFHYKDVSEYATIEGLFHEVDWVFNYAAIARTPWTIEDPLLSHKSTATGTLNSLYASARHGVKRFIHSSSCIVYVPNTPYYVAKLCAEAYVRVFSELYGLSAIALRYSNVYGSRQSERGPSPNVFAALRKSKKDNGKLLITGDGEQTRDYTHVSDIVEANYLSAQSAVSGAFYVGTSVATSLNEVAPYFDCPIEYIAERVGDIKHLVLDGSEFKERLKWEPKVTISEGIKDVL